MRILPPFLLSILLLAVSAVSAGAGRITEEYKEIEYGALKLAPENYKNDKVMYTEKFEKYHTTFANYMERSGFRSDKYIMLSVGDFKIPVIAKKTDEMVAFVGPLARNSVVKVYGKVRKFRVQSRGEIGAAPEYYVEAEKIEFVSKPEKEDNADKPTLQERNQELKEKLRRQKLRKRF